MPTLFLLLVTCLLAVPLEPEQSDNRLLLRIEVKDEMGAVIPNTHVFIRWDPSGSKVGVDSNVGVKEDLTFRTDDAGAAVARIPPGFYDVFVSSMAFSPQALKVRLKKQGLTLSLTLKIDPLVAKEMPDVTVQ